MAMRIAVTGGTGFVGSHLARALVARGCEVVLVARGLDRRDSAIRDLPGATLAPVGLSSADDLASAFAGCSAVAHCAGINRALGSQSWEQVHVRGTANVVAACRQAQVNKVLLLSFVRARPACGSPYHESKWAAEEIVRLSGLDYTIVKAGMIYGRGDHMLDHLSHALLTLPVFATVGWRERPIRPTAVEDVVRVLEAALLEGRLSRETVALLGPQAMLLSAAVRQVGRILGRKVLIFPLPVVSHRALAWCLERIMAIPLISRAQVRMLAEGMDQPLPGCGQLPADLAPATLFTDEQIRRHLPPAKPFSAADFRCCARAGS